MYNKFLKLAILSLCYMTISQVYALTGDETKPLQIDADNATLDQKNMTTVFTGNVIITRGSIIVHANKGIASQDANKDNIVILYGTPITFSQIQDDKQKITGQCNQFEYNTKTNLAILSGNAKIKKNKDSIISEQITYNTKTQTYSAKGLAANGVNKKQSGRVSVILDQMQNGK
ncbi:MAG: lipopolysaccharide transport periplasmic protein LptA [Proteobacteria bacterium]|jgi:lipopolysaccharide export system protein LptA|nr:lipopolysaccharide transport periplasmic protein LptA [Pseudomonadota bacterium]